MTDFVLEAAVVEVANGLLHLAIKHGHLDTAYIAGRTRGFEQVRRVVRGYWPDRVERITGVPVAQPDEAARLLGEATTAMVLTARGAEQHSNGTETTRPRASTSPRCGGRSGASARTGCVGLRDARSVGHRRWGADPAGVRVQHRRLRAPPHPHRRAAGPAGLPGCQRLRAVRDRGARRRRVALHPVGGGGGHAREPRRSGAVAPQALGPPPGVRSDLQTLHALAQRLGCPTSFPEAPREVFDELRAASAGGMADYAGITYERIASRLDEAMQQSVDAYRDPGQERAQPVTEGQFRRSHRREVGDLPTAQPRVPLGRRPVHHR
jgi:assimilatory nitrate reductase catalytic subunit